MNNNGNANDFEDAMRAHFRGTNINLPKYKKNDDIFVFFENFEVLTANMQGNDKELIDTLIGRFDTESQLKFTRKAPDYATLGNTYESVKKLCFRLFKNPSQELEYEEYFKTENLKKKETETVSDFFDRLVMQWTAWNNWLQTEDKSPNTDRDFILHFANANGMPESLSISILFNHQNGQLKTIRDLSEFLTDRTGSCHTFP